jgi:uncharacterized protein (DUF952 family)
MEAKILHVTSTDAWEAARSAGEYRTPDLAAIGFIHFCRPSQLRFVLDRYFAGRGGLVVLHVDVKRLLADLRWEASEPGMETFPHLYGPLNLDAIDYWGEPASADER